MTAFAIWVISGERISADPRTGSDGAVAIAELTDPGIEALPPIGSEDRLDVLRSLTLEDLLTAPATSVFRRPENRFESPAAIHVITGDEIRRSGARSFPEALRLAPGMTVGQLDANSWAVGARGFSDLFADKLLVLIDGRSIYSPYSSGVFWSAHDYLMEDVERIEVIRGPGGTLWGANAVNGVINIITKPAERTQGLYVEGGAGTDYRGFGAIRYGHALGENGFLRAFLKYHDHDNHDGGLDQWDFFQAGFRADWDLDDSHLTFSGEFHDGTSGSRVFLPNLTDPMLPFLAPSRSETTYQGGNLVLSYDRSFSEDSDLKIQAYYEHFGLKNRGEAPRREEVDVFDFDFQHRFAIGERQNFMYGIGYQYAPSNLRDNDFAQWLENQRNQQLFSAFVQDEITLIDDCLRFTFGTKVEHNDYTGWEWQPSARFVWTPAERQTIWGAVSRAVQVPARNFRDLRFPVLPAALGEADLGDPIGTVPVYAGAPGGADLDSQELLAYELGYRIQPTDNLSFDLAVFFNDYENLITPLTGDPVFMTDPVPFLSVPFSAINGGEAETWGGELVAEWRVNDWWRLQGTYSYLNFKGTDQISRAEGGDPEHMASLRSSFDLPGDVWLDFWFRYIDELSVAGISDYFDFDVRLAWNPTPDVEVAIVGQNLLDSARTEYFPPDVLISQITPVPRGGYLTVSFRY